MIRSELEKYLRDKNLKFQEINLSGLPFQVPKTLVFPNGILGFKDLQTSLLFIGATQGFEFSIRILDYYFNSDIVGRESTLKKPYKAIIVNNIEYTKLSPELLNALQLEYFARLIHNEVTEEPRLRANFYFEGTTLKNKIFF